MNDLHIDESHICLLKGWKTYEKMRTCSRELQEYFIETAKNVVEDAIRQHGDWLEGDKNCNEGWGLNPKKGEYHQFWLRPKKVANFKKLGVNLFWFGIEQIEPRFVERDGGFKAFVWSSDRESSINQEIFSPFESLLKSVPTPDGFLRDINPEAGYFLTQITKLNIDKLSDSKYLFQHMQRPIASVVDWYKQHEKKILAIKPLRFKRA